MIRGVSFEIPQEPADTLWQILSCVNIEKYRWFSIENQEEVWDEHKKDDFFNKNFYEGKAFAKYIQSKHYIVFLKLQAYFISDEFSKVCTYDDFLYGDCQILLLVNDCEYVEIYCKDNSISKAIYDNALSHKYKNVEYITDLNDYRTKMNVL